MKVTLLCLNKLLVLQQPLQHLPNALNMHLKRGSMGPTEDDKQINFQDLEDINMRLRGQFV